jgi:hypothetical protein
MQAKLKELKMMEERIIADLKLITQITQIFSIANLRNLCNQF